MQYKASKKLVDLLADYKQIKPIIPKGYLSFYQVKKLKNGNKEAKTAVQKIF